VLLQRSKKATTAYRCLLLFVCLQVNEESDGNKAVVAFLLFCYNTTKKAMVGCCHLLVVVLLQCSKEGNNNLPLPSFCYVVAAQQRKRQHIVVAFLC